MSRQTLTRQTLLRTGIEGVGSLISARARYVRVFALFAELSALYGRVQLKKRFASDADHSASFSEVHTVAARKITELCRHNGAVWVKAAQFMSVRPDVLPLEYIQELQTLQDAGKPVHFDDIRTVLDQDWGAGWEDHFAAFDLVPVATASIAQVYKAVLKDGRAVAVKVRLPGVRKLFSQDARVFRLLARMAAPLVPELDLVQIAEQLIEMTEAELDFTFEADNMTRFAALPHLPRIRIPEIHPDLSCESIMVSTWMEGTRLREHLDAHPHEAPDLLSLLLQSYIGQVTALGMYQADPHPGNFIVTPERDIAILDFGAIGMLRHDEIESYSRLLFGLVSGNDQLDYGKLFREAGFIGGSTETLKALADYVLTDKLNRSHPLAAVSDLMEKFRENHIHIPDTYVGIARVLITIGGFLMRYDVPFDWHPAMQAHSNAQT